MIHDCRSPQFVRKIAVDYYFEQQQVFKVEVYDSDNDRQGAQQDLNEHDFIGGCEFKMH